MNEYPNFIPNGSKDFSDAIRYVSMKGIKTYVFNLESIAVSLSCYDLKLAFNKYYGENILLVENLGDLTTTFSTSLLKIFSKSGN